MPVDATKLRRGVRRLGQPPTDSNPELAADVAPHTASADPGDWTAGVLPTHSLPSGPAAKAPLSTPGPLAPDHAQPAPGAAVSGLAGVRHPDGRSRRRTGRIEQINVKVSSQFNADLRGLADRQGLLIVEVLERALDTYLRIVAVAEASGKQVAQVLEGLPRR
jgi:hypothetical protein